MKKIERQEIAYRCPHCAVATLGFLGGLHSVSDMLRLRCECGESALEIRPIDGTKVHIDVPCVYCKDTHAYVISSDILRREQPTALPCPSSRHDILFIAGEADMASTLERSANELATILESFEAEDVKDIQPMDIDEAECAPDPAIYDVLNFVVRDLEDAGGISCPCKRGPYELRFTDDGAEVYCTSCGATYRFYATSASTAETYLAVDSITLS